MRKTILITGASSVIGESRTRHAVKAGHKVALAARRTDRLAALVDESDSDTALAMSCDVIDPSQQHGMIDDAVAHFDGLDMVFANAGLGESARGTEAGDSESFREMIEVNCLGVTYIAEYALPHLRASEGHLVLMGP